MSASVRTSMTTTVTEPVMTVVTIAKLTLLEASRRKVIWALAGLTAVLLALNAWGFHKLIGLDTSVGQMTSGQAMVIAAQLLNLVMFTLSLIVALGTAFLAGPTLAGELESGTALALFARPVRRSAVLLGKWLGLALFASGYVAIAGTLEFLVVRLTVGYEPPHPFTALALLAGEAIVLLTLALLLSSVLSPLSSGVLSVGLFGATWVAGVVGGIGVAIGNNGVARVGSVARVILPTDGLWHGAMNALQAPGVMSELGPAVVADPFVGVAPLSPGYLAWVAAWMGMALAICLVSFARRDL
jgi:ABC-type transport system involved in multi-copper enzyme maturation permease subunit